MKKRAAVGGTAIGILVLVAVGSLGGLTYLGSTSAKYSSGTGSSTDIPGMLSSGVSLLTAGLKFATTGGVPEVQTSGAGLIADTFTGDSPLAPTCSSTPKNSYIALTNSGTMNGTATQVVITYGGENNVFDISGQCDVGPKGSSTSTMYILFKGPSKLPNSLAPDPGKPYLGTIALSDGARLAFSGNFYQGYPSVTAESFLQASGFGQSLPGNSTCTDLRPSTGSYIELDNTGTVGASYTSVGLNWNGTTRSFPITGPCYIGPDGTPGAVLYVSMGTAGKAGTFPGIGQSYTGTVTPQWGSPIDVNGKFG